MPTPVAPTLAWLELVEAVREHFTRLGVTVANDGRLILDADIDNAIVAALDTLMLTEDRGMPSYIDFGGPVWDAIEAEVYERLELDYDVAKGL